MMESRGSTAWQGMTIKEILEKVDLSSFITDEEMEEKVKTTQVQPDKVKVEKVNSAFLGPKLWENSISIPLADQDEEEDGTFDVMNMDEFLAENNISLNQMKETNNWTSSVSVSSPGSSASSSYGNDTTIMELQVEKAEASPAPQRPNVIVSNKNVKKEGVRDLLRGDNEFLYAESKRARLEREKLERKRKFEVELDFAPEDLALATIPGLDFDPKKRAFELDELRPQPIIKKRSKIYVPDEKKDDRYWQRRIQNNIAAKRSREARRLKENQIALRAAYLEKENATLKKALEDAEFRATKLQTERDILRKKLDQYEPVGLPQ